MYRRRETGENFRVGKMKTNAYSVVRVRAGQTAAGRDGVRGALRRSSRGGTTGLAGAAGGLARLPRR